MSYASTILSDSPLRYYKMNESSGTTCIDYGSQATNGAYINTPTKGVASLLAGTSDTEVQFTAGSFQHITVPSAGLPTGAAAWTVEVWAAILSPVSIGGSAIEMGSFSAGKLICIETETGNHWRFSTYAQLPDVNSSGTYTSGTIHHLAATYNGTALAYYIDGVSVGGGTTTMNITYGSVYIGFGDADFNGILGEVAIYGTALSSTRIMAHYTAGITASVPKIIGNHRAFGRIQ